LEISELLQSLHAAAQLAPPTPVEPPAREPTETVIYHLDRNVTEDTEGRSGKFTVRPRDAAALATLLVDHLGASQWPAETTSIQTIDACLVIRQKESAHLAIHELLKQLEMLQSTQTPFVNTGTPVVGNFVPAR
jgi:hypothetical protein